MGTTSKTATKGLKARKISLHERKAFNSGHQREKKTGMHRSEPEEIGETFHFK